MSIDLLRGVLSNILFKHAVLRSTFRWTEAGLELNTLPDIQLELCEESLQKNEVSSFDTEIENIGHLFGSVPYDLERGPLYRFKLLRISASHHVLLCGFHHLVMDGTSWKIFVDEIIAALDSKKIFEPDISYVDFIQWQQCQVNSAQWAQARSHWNTLANKSHGYTLPGAKNVAKVSDYLGGKVDFKLDAPTTQALRHAALKFGLSPFRLALTAFLSFLFALTKQEGLFVATTLVGRPSEAYKKTLGLFVNTTLVGLSHAHEASFDRLVTELDLQLNVLLQHENYPYHFAIRDSAKSRDLSMDLLVPVSFTKLPSSCIRHVDDLSVVEQRMFLNVADRDLSIYMQDECGEFHFTWVYRSALFESATILRYAEAFQGMLRQVLENPQQPILDFDIVSSSERRALLIDWNQTEKHYPQSRCLHSLVQEQAARTPESIALVTLTESFSYKRINDLSNRLACFLHTRGIGLGQYIALIMKSSAELMIAELAVMKTGAAFCPIDPDWPTARVQSLLKQLDSQLIVLGPSVDSVHLDQHHEMVLMSDFMHDLDCEGSHRTASLATIPASTIDVPLYCLFTSGSTGVPKGAVNKHRGIINRLFAMNDLFGSAKDDIILATSSANADSLVWQYYWPLISGGRCIVVPKEDVIVPERMVQLFKHYSITVTDFVPAVFQLLVHYLEQHPEVLRYFGTLRRVLIGGDIFPVEAAKKFRMLLPRVAITNTYGPTETSIGVIFHDYDHEEPYPISIGRPIANVKAIVVDDELKLRPIGATGELLLGGVCVGLGYLSDPGLTHQKFIGNPFPELGCKTLYRTGDLVRYRSNGLLEFLGRIDDQIKIQGIRIEPGEIEAALSCYHSIASALVVCRIDQHGVKQLVAYVCAIAPHLQLKKSALRHFLLGILPRHMIPVIFMQVPALPLTASGKIDRRAQEFLYQRVLGDERAYVAPRNALETHIVSLWQEILGQKNIGIEDHFFSDLGGDSLSGILFVARFKGQAGIDLEMLTLYEYSTPSVLAEHLMQASNDIKKIPKSQSIDSIFDKQRLLVSSWKGQQSQPDSFLFTLNEDGMHSRLFWCFQGYEEFRELSVQLGEQQPITGMRSGHLIMQYTDEDIEALASRYAMEMMQLQPSGVFMIGGNCQGAIIAEATARALIDSGRLVALLILMEYSDFKPYDGKVSLIFGRESHLNPFKDDANPRTLFDQRLSRGYTIDLIDGAHGQFFSKNNLSSLSKVLTERLTRVLG